METGKKGINNKKDSQEPPVLANQEHLNSCGYHMLFEQATDAIMVTDFKGNFIDVNSSLCAMIGYTKNELLGMNVMELMVEEDVKNNPIRFDKLAQGENIFNERKGVHKNGSIICVESNAKKCGNDQVLIIARNITERKKTERILQESEANLQTIFNNTDTIYVLLDRDFRIISYNPRARAFAEKELGHNIEISKYFLDYFSIDKRPALLHYLEEVVTGRHVNYVVSYRQEDDVFTWYHVRLFPISNGDTKVYGVMMAVSDITEKTVLEQKLEEERIKKQQEITDAVITAEENERHQIGQELHDNVSQLLSTARLYIGIAKQRQGPENPGLIQKALTFIDTAMNEIRNLSHSLISPFIEEYGFVQALDHLAGSISKGGTLAIHKKIEVGENALDSKLKLAIYRIVQEQLNNIVKYANATTIKISLVQDDGYITLKITDDGVGFDTSKPSKGIGLMNIRTRASLFNGTSGIISSPGKGCTLKVVLENHK